MYSNARRRPGGARASWYDESEARSIALISAPGSGPRCLAVSTTSSVICCVSVPSPGAVAVAHLAGVGTSLRRSVRVRFDVDAKPTGQTDLLKSLRVLEALRARVEPLRARIEPAIRAVAADIEPARLEYRWIRRFFATRRRKEQGRAAFERLVVFLSSTQVMELRFDMERVAERLKDLGDTASAVWGDYAERSGAYNELLAEVSGQGSGKAREVASRDSCRRK